MKTTLLLLALLSLPVFAGDLPPDAAALKGKRDAKIAEINQLYANELEKLQKLALKNGSLEAANAIEKEIAAVIPNPLVNPIVGKWKWGNTLIAEFTPDGKAVAQGYVGKWTEKKSSSSEREYTVTWNNGSVIDYLTIMRDGEKAHAKNSKDQMFAAHKVDAVQ